MHARTLARSASTAPASHARLAHRRAPTRTLAHRCRGRKHSATRGSTHLRVFGAALELVELNGTLIRQLLPVYPCNPHSNGPNMTVSDRHAPACPIIAVTIHPASTPSGAQGAAANAQTTRVLGAELARGHAALAHERAVLARGRCREIIPVPRHFRNVHARFHTRVTYSGRGRQLGCLRATQRSLRL